MAKSVLNLFVFGQIAITLIIGCKEEDQRIPPNTIIGPWTLINTTSHDCIDPANNRILQCSSSCDWVFTTTSILVGNNLPVSYTMAGNTLFVSTDIGIQEWEYSIIGFNLSITAVGLVLTDGTIIEIPSITVPCYQTNNFEKR